jgi:hypothetical protein
LAGSGFEIIAFGRHRDLAGMVAGAPPDAIISKPEVVAQFGDYSVVMKGLYKSSTEEQYVLLSIDKKVKTDEMTPSLTVGVLDYFGKKETDAFVHKFLTGKPRTNRVAKLEDLLPLLSFNMAAAVMVSRREVEYFTSTSNLKFETVLVGGAQTGTTVLACKKGAPEEAIKNWSKAWTNPPMSCWG